MATIYFRFLPLFTNSPLTFALLANLDYIFFLYPASQVGVANLLIVEASIVVISLVSRWTFTSQQSALEVIAKRVDKQSSRKNKKKAKEKILYLLVATSATFRAHHTKMVNFLTAFNQAFCAPFFAAYLLGNLAYNAYSFVFIVYNTGRQSPEQRVAYIVWALLNGCTPLAVATFVVAINRRMYSSRSLLMSILTRAFANRNLKIKLNREQLKLPFYLELLDDGGARSQQRTKTMALGAGVFGVIERRTMCEFVLIYIAFLLHFGGLMIEK